MSFLRYFLAYSLFLAGSCQLMAMQKSVLLQDTPAPQLVQNMGLEKPYSLCKKGLGHVHEATLNCDDFFQVKHNTTLKVLTGAGAATAVAGAYLYARQSDAYQDSCKLAEKLTAAGTATGATLFGALWAKRWWDLRSLKKKYDNSAKTDAQNSDFFISSLWESEKRNSDHYLPTALNLFTTWNGNKAGLLKAIQGAAEISNITIADEDELRKRITLEKKEIEGYLGYLGTLCDAPQKIQDKIRSKTPSGIFPEVWPWNSYSTHLTAYIQENKEKVKNFTYTKPQKSQSWFQNNIAYGSCWWHFWNFSLFPSGQKAFELYWQWIHRYIRLCTLEYIIRGSTKVKKQQPTIKHKHTHKNKNS